MKYFTGEIHPPKYFKESEQNPIPDKNDIALMAIYSEGGILIRHKKELSPKLMEEIGEMIIKLAKRFQQ